MLGLGLWAIESQRANEKLMGLGVEYGFDRGLISIKGSPGLA